MTGNWPTLMPIFNPIQTGPYSDPPPPPCNFKTVNAMVTKLTQDDAHNNFSNFRCSDVIMTYYDVIYGVIYPILLTEKIFYQYFHNDSIYNHKLLLATFLISLLCLTIGWMS